MPITDDIAEAKSIRVGTPTPTSYGQILKSSSIIGGATGINYLIAMVRTKLIAVLLGPSGVGLVGLYMAATELVGTLTRMGINESGVREVAEAHGSGDAITVARTVNTLRKACWITGIMGCLLTAALSYSISVWTFGSGEHAWAIAILGSTLLFAAISGGQSALLQGTRRIGALARMGMVAAVISTVVAIALYAWLGQKGIVPVLISVAIINLVCSWWFSRHIRTVSIVVTWREALKNSRRLISVGLAFMYGGLLAAVVTLAIRSMIVRELGLEANGIFQAAWGISGMFAGFILGAMGSDFYPRLTAVANDNKEVNRLVNEQTEIGVLLALPGLLATLAFAPWLMRLFYSTKFVKGAELLPWLVVGIFAQTITFPLGFIQRAKGKARWIFLSQSHTHLLHLILALLMISHFGLIAAAWAFALSTCLHGFVVFAIARHLSRFAWTRSSVCLIVFAIGTVAVGFVAQKTTEGAVELLLGVLITGSACLISLRGIASRLGSNHRMVRLVLKFPGGRFACGSGHFSV